MSDLEKLTRKKKFHPILIVECQIYEKKIEKVINPRNKSPLK